LNKQVLAKKLIKCARNLHKRQFVISSSGNISGRLGKDTILINAGGVRLEKLKQSDFVRVDISTAKTDKKRCASSELFTHLACYRKRDDINCVIHVHPVFSHIIGLTKKSLPLVSVDAACLFSGGVPVIKYFTPGSKALCGGVGRAIKKHDGIILSYHGAIVVGKSVEEAFDRAVVLEDAAKAYVLGGLEQRIKGLGKSEIRSLLEVYLDTRS